VPRLEAAGAADHWLRVPIAGEVRPELQGRVFAADWDPVAEEFGQDFLACVRATHASWLMNYHAFNGEAGVGYVGEDLLRARAGALALGWEISVGQVRSAGRDLGDGAASLTLGVGLRNTGVAPFYYPLELSVTAACCAVEGRTAVGGLAPSEAPVEHVVTLDGLPASALTDSAFTVALRSPALLPGQRLSFANAEVDATGRLVLPAPVVGGPAGAP
jgi:hypothetical protein